MYFDSIYNRQDLQKSKNTVWKNSVLPFIIKKNTNVVQKALLWVAEHTLAGGIIGMLSIGSVGVFAWQNTKDVGSNPSLTEVVFKKNPVITPNKDELKPKKTYTKGTFQPIIVENDQNLAPLDSITSGNTDTNNAKK